MPRPNTGTPAYQAQVTWIREAAANIPNITLRELDILLFGYVMDPEYNAFAISEARALILKSMEPK